MYFVDTLLSAEQQVPLRGVVRLVMGMRPTVRVNLKMVIDLWIDPRRSRSCEILKMFTYTTCAIGIIEIYYLNNITSI